MRVPCSLALAFVTMLVASCGSGSPAAAPAPTTPALDRNQTATLRETGRGARRLGRAPLASERREIDKLLRVAEELRELRFDAPVPVAIQNEREITQQLTEQLEDDDVAEAQLVYGSLGLIDPAADLRSLMERLVAEQVIGYYDPEDDRLVVRNDVMRDLRRPADGPGLDEARLVLVHELVHALQDQHLGLQRATEAELDSDAGNALRAVVEGDATLAMLGYAAERAGGDLAALTAAPGLLKSMVNASDAVPGAELGSAPPIVRVTMVGAYLHGLVFSAAMYREGGWRAVDRAHRQRPVSTEQILHPALYLAQERPDELSFPELSPLEEAGLVPMAEDTLGELELGVYLAQGTGRDMDAEAAAGWGGDRLRVYRGPEGDLAAVWFTSWDEERHAREAEAAAQRVRRTVPSAERSRHLVERRGRALLIVRDLDPALHGSVRAAFAGAAGQLQRPNGSPAPSGSASADDGPRRSRAALTP